MLRNICEVKREMMKFQNQLLAAAEAWPRALMGVSKGL